MVPVTQTTLETNEQNAFKFLKNDLSNTENCFDPLKLFDNEKIKSLVATMLEEHNSLPFSWSFENIFFQNKNNFYPSQSITSHIYHAAPIFRYSDERLYGTAIVKPFADNIEKIKKVVKNPIHPSANKAKECAIKAFNFLAGAFGAALTSPMALVGRIVQMTHYHSLSLHNRFSPETVEVDGIRLPTLEIPLNMHLEKGYHGTNRQAAINILREGFNPGKTSTTSVMGQAAYISFDKTVSADYGDDQLVLNIDLDPREVAYLGETGRDNIEEAEAEYMNRHRDQHLPEETIKRNFQAAIQQLFLKNGFKAVGYKMIHWEAKDVLAVYDPKVITIKKVKARPLPKALPLVS